MEVVIGVLSIVTIILAITSYRLMKRVESMEDYVAEVEKSNDEYFKFFSQLKNM